MPRLLAGNLQGIAGINIITFADEAGYPGGHGLGDNAVLVLDGLREDKAGDIAARLTITVKIKVSVAGVEGKDITEVEIMPRRLRAGIDDNEGPAGIRDVFTGIGGDITDGILGVAGMVLLPGHDGIRFHQLGDVPVAGIGKAGGRSPRRIYQYG